LDKILILLYHRILPEEDDLSKVNSEERTFSVREKEFAKQMEYLNSNGWKTLNLSQLLEYLLNKTSFPEKSLVLSFDDGNQTDYSTAFPLLRKFGFKAAFFLTSDFINKPGYLQKSHVFEMSQAGMEFGSHGKTHKFLSTLNDKELKSELLDSKKMLEDIIGKEINLLSLPGGYFSPRVKTAAKEAGYRGICTSEFGWNDNKSDSFKLKRVSVKSGDLLADFICLISIDKKLYLKKEFKYKLLGMLKTILGANNYFKLWKVYPRFFKKND
jgi:peptidoglycan/xylan/chitin deacetylase (PgdA/CDA1 family)